MVGEGDDDKVEEVDRYWLLLFFFMVGRGGVGGEYEMLGLLVGFWDGMGVGEEVFCLGCVLFYVDVIVEYYEVVLVM